MVATAKEHEDNEDYRQFKAGLSPSLHSDSSNVNSEIDNQENDSVMNKAMQIFPLSDEPNPHDRQMMIKTKRLFFR